VLGIEPCINELLERRHLLRHRRDGVSLGNDSVSFYTRVVL
jgi:hypothetical protein